MLNEPNATVAVKTPTKLEDINAQLSDLHNLAVDIGQHAMQFNDRVQGSLPREAEKSQETATGSSALNGIQETLDYLRSSLNNINMEVSRLSDIG